ncbi:unnamed protein product [Leptosia nina]|uniref:Uncharacterized protein n=1 Tax=Leptosia nina TaxID=320188 RepID=A0AAV1J0J7_9NEOP
MSKLALNQIYAIENEPYFLVVVSIVNNHNLYILNTAQGLEVHTRQRRYLIFTPSTQWGVFATVAVPLDTEATVSVAWFFEANYYTVDNATYYEPLLGDIEVARNGKQRRAIDTRNIVTRKYFYTFIENMLEKHGHPGRSCLLRAICENATSHFLHNGILGDVLHLVLTPSTSISEELIEDSYYEAEFWGLEDKCHFYAEACPISPLDYISIIIILLSVAANSHDVEKRALIFPPTTLYGIFVAIAVPLDIPDKNVFVSYNFEANYGVVTNITEIDEVLFPNLPIVSRHSRSITRELAYLVLETKFQENGMNGRDCLLRNICEAAETPLHHNGLLGHLMHIIFTPSASKEERIDDVYYEAEADGQNGDCDKYYDLCPYSLFDIITRLAVIKH